MFKNNVYTFKSFPVEQRERRWTDCCCTIIGAIFALTLFIISLFMYTSENFYEVNFPIDRTQTTCMYEQKDAPYIYFQNPNDIVNNKYCLKSCPLNGELLKCSNDHPCPNIRSNYQTSRIINRLGGFCQPTDEDLKTKFWDQDILRDKANLVGGYDTIEWSLLIALCVGFLYLLAVVLMPRVMTFAVFFLAFVTLLICGILLIAQPIAMLSLTNNGWNIFLGIVLIIISLIILIFLFCYKEQIELGAIFMHDTNAFLTQNPIIFLYIPLYILLSFGLVVLCIWQYIAFGTEDKPIYTKGNLYETSNQNMFLQILNFIQFVWGIQFIRDSGNYLISGNAVEWYFNYRERQSSHCSRPITRLICKNWGSVGGGSFLNAFFSIFSIIVDLFRCDPKGKCGRANYFCKTICCCCTYILDLVRSDAYAYIHLSGIPYCNAARQMQALCENCNLFTSDHTCIHLYRLAAQIFVVTLSVLFSFIILKSQVTYANAIIIALIICSCYLVATHFADLHANAAEGIFTCFLAEHNCEGDRYMQVCPDCIRSEVYAFEQKYNLTHE